MIKDKNIIIEQLDFDEVIVRCHPGVINSAILNKPLHKLPVGGKPGWSVQFDELPKLILRLKLSNGIIGLGEFYRDHDWEKIIAMSNILIGKSIQDLTLQSLPLAKYREYDGFECAIWDAYAKSNGLRIVDLLGGPLRDKIKVSAWSSHRTIEEIGPLAKKYKDLGYDTLKLKADLDDPVLEWCQTIKDYANSMKVILDPNERWQNTSYARTRLKNLETVGNVLLVEDPIPHWMWQDYALLRNFTSIPIVRHVSIPYAQQGQSVSDAINAIKHGAVDGFNFNAGISTFMQLDSISAAANLNCWHGSEIDLGILEALYIHKAAAAKSCIWPSDIFGRLLRQHDLLKKPIILNAPFAYLPSSTGLGVEIDMDAIDKFKVKDKTIKLS